MGLWSRGKLWSTTRPGGHSHGAVQDVGQQERDIPTFHHPRVGATTLTSQSTRLDGTPGRRTGVCTAEPAAPTTTPSEDFGAGVRAGGGQRRPLRSRSRS
ncbi:MmyB family transcriptional regulator [Streptomyces sp. NPDC004082]|uniref:MmyB family transcriptional regulator n=1 Tax=Streptomyces sp. NPDC005496 TaxID=3364716 RepID=UPI0036AB7DCF